MSFDLKDLNLKKHFERLRKDFFFALQLAWSDQMYVVYALR